MKPHEVADRLDIGTSTVRAWSVEYRQYLSPSAQGGDGRYRDFNDHDLRVISLINQLKKRSAPPAEIHNVLQQLQSDDWKDLPPLPNSPSAMASVPVVPEDAALADRRGLLQEIAIRQSRIEELTTELEREREAAKADRERLLREIGELRQQLGTLEEQVKSARLSALLELYEQGRIKPKDE